MGSRLRGSGLVGLVVMVVLVATPGIASATPVTFSGSITCSMSATLKFKPALKNGGTAPETVTLAAALGGCSGDISQFGKTITKGVMTASGVATGNDCATYLTEGHLLPALNGTTKWSPLGIAPTTIHYSGESVAADFNTGAVSASLPDALGTATATAGSFVGPISPLSNAGVNADAGVLFRKCQTVGITSLSGISGTITIG